MKQIGYRAEAGRLGGIGSCGRELCCSTWLTDFRAVSTSAARYQQLSLNPTKLAGQCGKLKCCLNYELDQYVEAVKDLPPTHVKLRLPKGTAYHFKTDIFKKVIYYTLENEPGSAPFALSTQMVFDIIEKNKKGQDVVINESVYLSDKEKEKEEEVGFAQVVGQDSLTRFDKSKNKKKPFVKNNNKPQQGNQKTQGGNRPQNNGPKPQNAGPKKENTGPATEGAKPNPPKKKHVPFKKDNNKPSSPSKPNNE
jgi:hypothetical protein